MSTTAIEKRPVIEIIRGNADEFAKRLPAGMDANRWTMQLATLVQKNPDLLQAEPRSLLLAANEAAEVGISLSPALGHGYLVRFKDQCALIIGYKGLIQKVHGAGTVKTFFAEVVFSNDYFQRQLAPRKNIFHVPADGDRGEAIGSYALVEYVDGTIDFEFMTAEQIGRRRKHSRAPDSMMWTTFWEEAWRKTPIRALFKRIPLSNPGLERLAELIHREAELDSEAQPAGRLELDPDSPLAQVKQEPGVGANTQTTPPSPCVASKKSAQSAPESQRETVTEVFFQVGTDTTTVSGRTQLLKDDLPKIGARWDGKARLWTLPASRTDEFIALAEAKDVQALEVLPDEPRETATEAETLWPKGEEANRARE